MLDLNLNPDEVLLYEHFVRERHAIWTQRQRGAAAPWTPDVILATYKFTNVFRVLDPGSQFALLLQQDDEPLEAFFRAVLYRYTNLPTTWRHFYHRHGRYPTISDARCGRLLRTWREFRDDGNTVFSGAYVILPMPGRKGDKLAQAIDLALHLVDANGREFIADRSQTGKYGNLTMMYGVGKFMAQQILTDWGYGPHCPQRADLEDDFCVPGPGAERGIDWLLRWPGMIQQPRRSYERDMAVMRQLVAYWASPGCPALCGPDGQVRYLSVMDVQNTLCEYSKYRRYVHRRQPGDGARAYSPAHPGRQPAPLYPPHWWR